jgi:hypothetical protein
MREENLEPYRPLPTQKKDQGQGNLGKTSLKALRAFLDEAADAYVGGYGDETVSALESIPPTGSLIDKPGYLERLQRNLDRRQQARAKTQDEQYISAPLGAFTGTMFSPIRTAVGLPKEMAASAVEEMGRSDPQSGLEYLKALLIGAGQGAVQHFTPPVVRRVVSNPTVRKVIPPTVDVLQSNIAPGIERKVEAGVDRATDRFRQMFEEQEPSPVPPMPPRR